MKSLAAPDKGTWVDGDVIKDHSQTELTILVLDRPMEGFGVNLRQLHIFSHGGGGRLGQLLFCVPAP